MKTKNLVLIALLIALGTVLYLVVPGYGDGMKPDFILVMMFISILLFPRFKETFLVVILAGVLSGIFTTFPGGLVPNIIDKIITGFVFFAVVSLLKNYAQKLVVGIILVLLGTFLSGTVFLTAALIIVGLPGGAAFGSLFVAVVIPTAILSAILFAIIYPIITKLMKELKFESSVYQSK